MLYSVGRIPEALEQGLRSYRIAERRRPVRELARHHLNLALYLGDSGRPGESLRHARTALQITAEQGLEPTLGVCLIRLGAAYTQLGRLDAAERCLLLAERLTRRPRFAYNDTHSPIALGELELCRNRPVEAVAWFRTGLRRAREHGQAHTESDAANGLGAAATDPVRALRLRRQALAILEPTGSRHTAAVAALLAARG